jgi:hypothetical protein
MWFASTCFVIGLRSTPAFEARIGQNAQVLRPLTWAFRPCN